MSRVLRDVSFEDEDGWRIGFDVCHAGDGWQDEEWTRNECRRLAAQCIQAGGGRG